MSDTAQLDLVEQRVDPRLVFLMRTSVWLDLVEHEAATLDEAVDALTPAYAISVRSGNAGALGTEHPGHARHLLRSQYRGGARPYQLEVIEDWRKNIGGASASRSLSRRPRHRQAEIIRGLGKSNDRAAASPPA